MITHPRSARNISAALALAALSLTAAFAAPAQDALSRAMRDELDRTTTQLKLEKNAPPYFVAYRVQDTRTALVEASFGRITARDRELAHERNAIVELRVGSPAFDQTNLLLNYGHELDGPLYTTKLPLDDNYVELRRQFWLLTNGAYMRSLALLAKKKAVLQNKTRPDETNDFTVETPKQLESSAPPLTYDVAATERIARELSAMFREFPAIDRSSVTISHKEETEHFLDSEGTTYLRRTCYVAVEVDADTQAPDGRALLDDFTERAASLDALPALPQLLTKVRALGARLTARRGAALIDTYNGPVLFEGEAAAEVFADNFAENLVAVKRAVVGDPKLAADMTARENPLMNKLGARVLPTFLNVTDDPTRREFAGAPLLCATPFDDDGVPTRAVDLVVAGRLKTLLTSRVPSPGLPKSTGSRHGGGPCPTNLLVTAEGGQTAAELKAQLVKLAQQRGLSYGIVIRRIHPEVVAAKVFLDGHEELLRNVDADDPSIDAFRDIVAAGREPVVYHTLMNLSRAAGTPSNEGVSLVVPALLFEEVTLKKEEGEIPQLPVSRHPYFDK